MNALTASNVSVHYGTRQILFEVSLPPLRAGELTVFAGPNGAGKSTLLRAIAHLTKAAGSFRLGDLDLGRASAAERASLLGFMPQHLPFGAVLTVLESVITALLSVRDKGDGRSIAQLEDKALETLERLGIAELAMKPLDSMSGGQRQLASLAQAIVREPQVILLDEPTSALDLRHQFQVMEIVRNLASSGRNIVVVLHDLSLAAQWADRIVILKEGRIYSEGTPAQTITPQSLRDVYGVEATVDQDFRGRLRIMVDGVAAADAPVSSETPKLRRISA